MSNPSLCLDGLALTKVFIGNGKPEFTAKEEAMSYLEARGFSVGSWMRGAPAGVLYGEGIKIAKWRNLNATERGELHGTIRGDGRFGPIYIEIFTWAPEAAKRAFLLAPATNET